MGTSRASKNILHYGRAIGKTIKGTARNMAESPKRAVKNLMSKEYRQSTINRVRNMMK